MVAVPLTASPASNEQSLKTIETLSPEEIPTPGLAIEIVSVAEPLTEQLTVVVDVTPFGGLTSTPRGRPLEYEAWSSEFAAGSTRVERLVASEVLEEMLAVGVPLEGGGVAVVQATAMLVTLALPTVPAPLDTVQFSPLGWVATETL